MGLEQQVTATSGFEVGSSKWVSRGSCRHGSLVARSTDQDGSHSRKRHDDTAWAWAVSRGGSLCLASLSLISLSRLLAFKSHFPFFSFFSFVFLLSPFGLVLDC